MSPTELGSDATDSIIGGSEGCCKVGSVVAMGILGTVAGEIVDAVDMPGISVFCCSKGVCGVVRDCAFGAMFGLVDELGTC